ncbi:putative bifunctional diguanylate cyclase/phosphodiesterase [Marinospirillum alkaliphilum]|uniref:cyclic-guanylate-specific phosphodiesterase n=1 Tax=Marinospirillum alkaliphilum DSM 21637 TaxID=1122209 RepID=A0A1K1X4A9_9GAMM|nr:bifunctional diguanylate cyclase/phosphodiesterase [Marinospirillum alkaliphilum]SFX44482.1 PAS domain S-box-containing protein/diguanylate cyclase (GGDEF) domain-containing protein [Marinospirillum alkaliphilum DSM 21637]
MNLQTLSRQEAILEASTEMIATVSLDQQLLYLNLAGRRMLGIPATANLEQQVFRIRDFHADEAYRYLNEEVFPRLAAGEARWEGEVEFTSLEGEVFPGHLIVIAHRGQEGELQWITGIMRDLRRRKEFEAQQRLAMRVFDNTIEGIMVTDGHARIQQINAAFTEITGYTAEEMIGKTPRVLRSEHHDQAFYDAMWQSIADTDRWQGEIWNRRKDGGVYLQWLSINCVRNARGFIEHYISIFHDLTEMRAKEAEIQHLAHHDPLTGLGNRHQLGERLRHAVRQARSQKGNLALLVMDLGNIQLINESLGHTWCDRLIRHQSARLREVVSEADTLVRIGADEFALLVEDYESLHDISQLAHQLKLVLQEEVSLGEHRVILSPSIGVAFFPEDADSADQLLTNAQAALAEAKHSGRDTFRFFDQDMSREARDRLKLEQALRSAIKGGGLSLHYQPKVRLETAGVYGAEALLRWTHPELGPLSPAVFIPLAEESGLIVEIGAWVLQEACNALVRWRASGQQLPRIAVNISVQQLEREDFPGWLERLLISHQLERDLLELEITETGLMQNEQRALRSLVRLQQKGFRIALDDFGTGYSSLSYLRKLPLSTLKIDRSFVMDMSADKVSLSIVRTIIQLAHNLDLDLVAEGVEDEIQAQLLLDMGCEQAQGFHYHRPMPEADFVALLTG